MKDGLTDLEKKIPSDVENEDFQTFEKLVNRETTQADAPLAMEIKKTFQFIQGIYLGTVQTHLKENRNY